MQSITLETCGIVRQQLQDKISALPMNLNTNDIADFLGISKTAAYTLVHRPVFPMKSLPGMRRLIIPKVKFIEWYLSECENED